MNVCIIIFAILFSYFEHISMSKSEDAAKSRVSHRHFEQINSIEFIAELHASGRSARGGALLLR